MSKIVEGHLRVSAIRNGLVIDHIPSDQLHKVVRLLDMYELSDPYTIGQNYTSGKLGKKGIIKIENRQFTPEEVNKLALVAPEAVINVIQDYEVVQKIRAKLPDEVVGLVKCTNSKCVSNNEPMQSRFACIDTDKGTLQCIYCMRKIQKEDIVIL